MAKKKTVHVCQECGHESPKWNGQCFACGAYNTYVQEVVSKKPKSYSRVHNQSQDRKPKSLQEVASKERDRMITQVNELDRVLGGGIVPGSLLLIGGDPGIGKSTLMLQICTSLMAQGQEILYVSGEESLRQIKLRSQRLKVKGEGLSLFAETNIDQVETTIISSQPTIVMVDSIQTMVSDDITSAAGSVSQVREVTTRLMRLAKHMNIAIFIVGHVTKEGAIAGPRVLEHMVDTVLYFEGDKSASYRLLRAVKNRFGSTNEIGVFEMTDKGLVQVLNPSEYMLTGRPINEPGSVVICGLEGSRPLFIEGQALLTTTSFNMPRRTANGIDYNRLLMLLAVVEKKVDFTVNTQDSYVNIAGGIKLNEPALDLGIVAAILSSFYEKAVNPQAVFMGEVGLTGEVRGITFCQDRVKEAKKLGFEVCYVPQANLRHLSKIKGIQVVGISNIRQLKTEIF